VPSRTEESATGKCIGQRLQLHQLRGLRPIAHERKEEAQTATKHVRILDGTCVLQGLREGARCFGGAKLLRV